MSTLSHEPVSVYSHPYRPELSLLRVWLLRNGYHPLAVETISSHAAAHGTLEGLVQTYWLEAEDEALAEQVFVGAMEPVPHVSHEWDDPGVWMTTSEDPTFPRLRTNAERVAAAVEVRAYFAERSRIDARVDGLIGGEWD